VGKERRQAPSPARFLTLARLPSIRRLLRARNEPVGGNVEIAGGILFALVVLVLLLKWGRAVFPRM
jgi:hypothetical protein